MAHGPLVIYVTAMPPIKFQVNWPFGSGEEEKPRSWISGRNKLFLTYNHPCSVEERKIDFQDDMAVILDFRLERLKPFLIYKSPRCFLPSFKSICRLVQEKKR